MAMKRINNYTNNNMYRGKKNCVHGLPAQPAARKIIIGRKPFIYNKILFDGLGSPHRMYRMYVNV